jgi:hypothetical protein
MDDDIPKLVISFALNVWLIFAVLRRDERRLTPAELERAWLPATRLAAGVYFGILCLPVHFWKTRRSWKGLLMGVAWGVGIALLDEVVDWGVDVWRDFAMTLPPLR